MRVTHNNWGFLKGLQGTLMEDFKHYRFFFFTIQIKDNYNIYNKILFFVKIIHFKYVHTFNI